MVLVDIHSHILAETDDGAKSMGEMYQLIDEEYKQGVRYLCFTPHFHPGYYGDLTEKQNNSLKKAIDYVETMYSDMKLFLGNELHYYQGCLEAVKADVCFTINGSRYLLVDFSYDERQDVIESALMSILRQGYIPILAHVERYRCFLHKQNAVEQLHHRGVVIQVNASSIIKNRYFWRIKSLLKKNIVDVIASDTHDIEKRPPMMLNAYMKIQKIYGDEYAKSLFYEIPYKILSL